MFSTTVNTEYAVAAGILGLDTAWVAELARQGVRYSFLGDAGKTALLAEIDAYAANG
jgi:adenosine deaminase